MTLAAAVTNQTGRVLSVYEVELGAALVTGTSVGATYLEVEDVDDFADDGGTLILGSLITADLTTEQIAYTSVDRDLARIYLAAAYPAEFVVFVAGDHVRVDPPATERRADIALDGEADQTVTARIPFTLSASFPLGVRDDVAGEWVRVAVTDYAYTVVDAINAYATTDPASIVITDPDTGESAGEIGSDAAFHSVTAEIIDSPSVPKRNPDDLVLYVDPVTGDDANGGKSIYPLSDTFERANATAWGTADTGQTWGQVVYDGQGTPDVVVGPPGFGRLRGNAGNQQGIMRSTFAALDAEGFARIAFNQSPTAGAIQAGLVRAADSQNVFGAELQLNNAGRVFLLLLRRLGGTWANIGTSLEILPSGYVGGTVYCLRIQIQANPEGGTDIRAKAWVASGTEPDDWQATVNDTSTSGGISTTAGFGAHMRTGAGFTGTVGTQHHEITFASIDSGGSVIDTSEGGVGPLASVSAALARLGDWNDGDVRINLTGAIEEDVEINGLGGGGTLTIDGADVTTIYGAIRLYGVNHRVEIRDLIVQDMLTPGPTTTIDVRVTSYVQLVGLSIQSNGRTNAIAYSDGSHGRVEDCQINGASSRLVYVLNGSLCYAIDNRGGDAGQSYNATAAIIFVSGTKPSPATNTAVGGQIFGTTTNSGGSAPAPNPKRTEAIAANRTRTWRPEWAWRTDNDEAYQGEWQGSGGLSRGCAFYGTKLRKSGKTADKGQIYVKRLSSGGASGKEAIYLAVHPLESQPSGDSGPNVTMAPVKIGSLAWGEGAWFTIPVGMVQSVMTGAGRGFMIYHESASPYVIAAGKGNGEANFKVKITYH